MLRLLIVGGLRSKRVDEVCDPVGMNLERGGSREGTSARPFMGISGQGASLYDDPEPQSEITAPGTVDEIPHPENRSEVSSAVAVSASDQGCEVAADKLTNLLTTNPEVKFAFAALQLAAAKYDGHPTDAEALKQRNAALRRYVGILKKLVGPDTETFNDSLASAAQIIDSSDATPGDKDFLAQSLILIGVAILASVSAGAIGALLVKEVIWKEVVKAAVGAFITTTATLGAERAWRRSATESGHQ